MRNLYLSSVEYKIFLIIGDFNTKVILKSFVKEPTCYKNPEWPSGIDLILAVPTIFKIHVL